MYSILIIVKQQKNCKQNSLEISIIDEIEYLGRMKLSACPGNVKKDKNSHLSANEG